jgi:hypothetical protein
MHEKKKLFNCFSYVPIYVHICVVLMSSKYAFYSSIFVEFALRKKTQIANYSKLNCSNLPKVDFAFVSYLQRF